MLLLLLQLLQHAALTVVSLQTRPASCSSYMHGTRKPYHSCRRLSCLRMWAGAQALVPSLCQMRNLLLQVDSRGCGAEVASLQLGQLRLRVVARRRCATQTPPATRRLCRVSLPTHRRMPLLRTRHYLRSTGDYDSASAVEVPQQHRLLSPCKVGAGGRGSLATLLLRR
jgi:hypothetical protein